MCARRSRTTSSSAVRCGREMGDGGERSREADSNGEGKHAEISPDVLGKERTLSVTTLLASQLTSSPHLPTHVLTSQLTSSPPNSLCAPWSFAGQSGLGKSTFVRTLLADSSFIPREDDKPKELATAKTTEVKVYSTGSLGLRRRGVCAARCL